VPNERLVRVASAAPPAPSARPTRPTPPAPIPSPPDTAGVTQAFAKASEKLPPPAPRPSFQSMFTDRVSQPLAQTVNNLWGPPTPGAPATAQSVRVLDLFTDTRPNERKLLGDKA
jgi:hypothetical protein